MEQWVEIKSIQDTKDLIEQVKENKKLLLTILAHVKKQETILKKLETKSKPKPKTLYPLSILDLINLKNIEPIEKNPNL